MSPNDRLLYWLVWVVICSAALLVSIGFILGDIR